MPSKPLSYTTYRDPAQTGAPLRTGSSDRAESARDQESAWRSLAEIHQSAMHGWGVVEGFVVRLVTGGAGIPEVRVGTGVAIDSAGRTLSLGRGQAVPNAPFFSGAAELGPQANAPGAVPTLGHVYQNVDTSNPANNYDYVTMTASATAGTRVLTVQYWEWFNQGFATDQLYFYDQTPWLRLLDPSQVVDGVTIPLAEIVIASNGAIQSVGPGQRRSCTLPARSVQLLKARQASNSMVNDVAFAQLGPRTGGGLDLVIPSAPPDADDQLALQVTVAGAQALAVKKSGIAIGGDTAINGKHAFRGNDAWLRLNQDGAFTSGVHTPGNFAPNSLNVGGVGGWGNPGAGNAWIAGSLSVGTSLSIGGDVALNGKHAFRANDAWLRLNQDGAFTSGVHTPGNFAPNSLNVGGVGGWGNPGAGNAWIAGTLNVKGLVGLGADPFAGQVGDRRSVGLNVGASIQFSDTLATPGRMHLYGPELCYFLHNSGVIISKAWGGTGTLTVEGNFITVNGAGGEMAVVGGDGAGNDVQIGSSKSGVWTVAAWNFATGWMDVAGRNWLGHSDARSKERIESFTGGLEKVLKLRPVTFHWKNDEKKADQLGLVAQEVREVLPLAVQESSRGGSLSIAYNSLVALLIQAVKEQQAQLDQLQKTVAELPKR